MKKAVVAFFLVVAASLAPVAPVANASVNPGWERPIYRAHMEIGHRVAKLENVQKVDLIMTQKDGKSVPTGIVLKVDGTAMNFEIVHASIDACGAAQYLAAPLSERTGVSIQNLRLILADYSARTCDTAKVSGAVWQALLQDMGKPLLSLTGTPEAVITIQTRPGSPQ